MSNHPFILSIETVEGKSFVHGFHLGTDERLARQIAEEKFRARVADNLPVVTVAIVRNYKMVDCFDGRDWFSEVAWPSM